MNPADLSSPTPLPHAESVVLLVSDDDALVARISSMTAPDRSMSVHVARSVGDAEVAALEVHPTVVLLDLAVSGRTPALDLLRRLHRRPETAYLPVMVLGGPEESQLRGAVFDAGAADFVEKLPDPIELRGRIRQLSQSFHVRTERNEAVAAIGRLQRQLREVRSEVPGRAGGDGAAGEESDAFRAKLDAVTRLSVELSRIHDFHLLMERILSEARALVRADAGTIYIREVGALRFAFSQNDTLEAPGRVSSTRLSSLSVPISASSVAGWCAMSGEVINVEDAYSIPRGLPYGFDRSYDAVTGYRTRSVIAVPLRSTSDTLLGVLQLLNAKDAFGDPAPRFSREDERMAEHFASMATVVIERAQLTESVILRMIRMAEVRDPAETGAHIDRVAGYSLVIFDEWARRRGFAGPGFERQRDRLRIAAKLHDVGKIGISDAILKKPGRLDHDELRQMHHHTLIGARLFVDSPTQFDETAREVVLNHHERWDGTGYPGYVDLSGRPVPDAATGLPRTGGKRGEDIPLFARIVGLADVFDALSSRRSYKEPWDEARVLAHIRAESGRHFDPELVEILLARIDEIRQVRDAHPPE
ncbi:MAG: HD domain-containing protein [Phycisphaerales bacterium]